MFSNEQILSEMPIFSNSFFLHFLIIILYCSIVEIVISSNVNYGIIVHKFPPNTLINYIIILGSHFYTKFYTLFLPKKSLNFLPSKVKDILHNTVKDIQQNLRDYILEISIQI